MERSEIRGRARERVGRSRITLRSIRATFLMRWEADERPEPRSLGLLPSGPDPVGEWLVHRQPPGHYIGRESLESKRRRGCACAQRTDKVEWPQSSIFLDIWDALRDRDREGCRQLFR